VGSAASTGTFVPGFTFPEGEISFAGGTFNRIEISSTAAGFAVDNINVTPASAPVPGTFSLAGRPFCAGSIRIVAGALGWKGSNSPCNSR
jgi:hypothetical protein